MVSPDTSKVDQALALLLRPEASMAEVMAALAVLDRSDAAFRPMKAAIAANVTVDLFSTYLRRHAYLAGVRLSVDKGSYNDLVGDAQSHADVDCLIVLPFFDNLQPSWESQLGALDESARTTVHADYLNRLDLALQAAQAVGQVLVLGPHLYGVDAGTGSAQLDAVRAFDTGLQQVIADYANARRIETAALVAQIGARQAFDHRFYWRGKAPYKAVFLDLLARQVALSTRGFGSQFHKVLVLDCDNTLWGGIVGEDGLQGLQLDPHSYPGNVFWTVQQLFKHLESQGVLVCLSSKNNPRDVDEVLREHPCMVLRDAQLLVKRVNWDDKPGNLKALAAQLNLGLDSFVFIDDSDFEVQAVREQLPQVAVFQVPKALQDYPAMVREQIMPLFLAGSVSEESRSKTAQYRGLAQATELQSRFSNQEDYLRSLGMVVCLKRDDRTAVARIAELMGKSNQFNLTTQRLQPGELLTLMAQDDAVVYSFSVSDRLTDHGLTGVLIVQDQADDVCVHSFLMSCRIIGRGVEFAVWQAVVRDALARGKRRLSATYRPTAKNAQVADFYDRLGLCRTYEAENGDRSYEAQLGSFLLPDTTGVELRDA